MSYYSYADFENGINIIFNSICKENVQYDCIAGVNRGGLIPGVALSYRLKVPFVPLRYSNRDFSHCNLTDAYTDEMFKKSTKVLLVDDILDTGETINYLLKDLNFYKMSKIDVAVLIWNISAKAPIPKYNHWTINREQDIYSKDIWYDFFWDFNQ